jgi:hypothetical protein
LVVVRATDLVVVETNGGDILLNGATTEFITIENVVHLKTVNGGQ